MELVAEIHHSCVKSTNEREAAETFTGCPTRNYPGIRQLSRGLDNRKFGTSFAPSLQGTLLN